MDSFNGLDSNILNQYIDLIGLTIGQILQILSEKDDTFSKAVQKYKFSNAKVIPLSAQGFFSKIYKFCIFAQNEEKVIYSVLIKKPTAEKFDKLADEGGIDAEMVRSFHNNECNFYEKFDKISNFPKPKVFYIKKFLNEENQNGVILMEDFSDAAKIFDVAESLTKEQIKVVVDALASFHAYIFSVDEKMWKNQFINCAFITIHNVKMPQMTQPTLDKLEKLRPGTFDHLFKKLNRFIYETDAVQYCVTECCKDIGIPLVLCQGDLWNNNILWYLNSDGSISNRVAAFIDYHYACEGNPAYDMARMLVFGCDPEIRHEIEESIFDFYFEKLTKYMKANGQTPGFNVEQLKRSYIYSACHNAWMISLHSIFHPANQVAEIGEEATKVLQERLIKRAIAALEDTVKALEIEKPEWLS